MKPNPAPSKVQERALPGLVLPALGIELNEAGEMKIFRQDAQKDKSRTN